MKNEKVIKMEKTIWTEITQDDVIKAIKSFLADATDYPEPRSTYLVYEGKKLPAKHIRGMAYRVHYGYEITKDEGSGEVDTSNQIETENKNWQLSFPAGRSGDVVDRSEKISDSIYREKNGDANVFYLLVDGMDIMLPEVVQPLLYSEKIKSYPNRRYVIVNRHRSVDRKFFAEKLSVILKVRAMENFCAVVFESAEGSKCYQCGKNRTAQVVKARDGIFGIDLDRTSGPEAIWKDKKGMRKSWRKNYEWLVQNATRLYNE